MTPFEWLETFLECAVDTLDEQVPPFKGAPPRQYVSPDVAPPFDDCCEHGGQLYTRLVTAMPVNPIPIPDSSFTGCSHTMGIQIAVGIVRCSHTLDDQGNPPTPEQMTADARQLTEDMVSIRNAIVCCSGARRLVLGSWMSKGGGPFGGALLGGGCMSGEWTVWVPASFTNYTGSPTDPESP